MLGGDWRAMANQRLLGWGGAGTTLSQLNRDWYESLRILRRRLSVVIVTITVLMSLVVAFIWIAPPLYTASSQIVFDTRLPHNSIDIRPNLPEQPPDPAFMLSEVDVIRSRSLAKRVIEELHLDQNPDFNSSLRPDGTVTALLKRYLPERWLFVKAAASPEIQRDRLVDDFQRKVKAALNPRSQTVNVSFKARQPQLAADVVNALINLYLVSRMEDRLNNAKRATMWLTEQIQKLKDQAEQSAQAVETYRATHNLFEASRETLISKQIGELDARLTEAGIARQTAEANLMQVHGMLYPPPPGVGGTTRHSNDAEIDALPQVLQSDLIRKYREEELVLERREAQMAQEYGNRHPALLQLRAEKQRLKEKIRTEIERIALGLEIQVRIAGDHENSLRAKLKETTSTVAKANADSIGLRELERQADAAKILLERMLGALLQTNAEENVKSQAPDARVISTAPVPENPSFPPKLYLLLAGFLVSAFAGVLLAFVVEHLDGGVRSSEEVEAISGLPVLAQVPIVRRGKAEPAAYALDHPRSAYAATVHAIYTRLLLMSGGRPPKVLLFTSAEPEEGKSTISLSLARQEALSGRRVVLVEADLHRPSIARLAGVGSAPGLIEVLYEAIDLRDAIQRDSRSTVDVIVAGGQQGTHSGKLTFDAIGTVLSVLRDAYDVIVLDASPVLGFADNNIFCALADATLMILQWGKTRRQVFRCGVGEITRFGGRIDGVILSKVDTRKQAYYDYGGSYAYTGKTAKASEPVR